MNKKYGLAALGLIVFAGIFFRLTPIMWERDLWYDEAFTGILLKAPFAEMNQMIFDDVHPPLYYWLAKPWAALFDYSPFGIRSHSLIFGIATIISGYWIAAKMFKNQRAGLLAAALLAFSPFAIEYSQEARMYSLFGFLFLWSVWFFYQALENNRTRDWVLWGVFGGLSFYSHYLSLFFFVLFCAAFVAFQRIFKKSQGIKAFLGSKGFWLGTGVIFLFFASWLKIFIPHMLKGNLGWIGVSYLSDIPKTLQIFFFGHPPGAGGVPSPNEFHYVSVGKNVIHEVPLFDQYSAGLLILLLIVFAGGFLWAKKKKQKEILVLSMMSLGTLIFLIFLSFLNIKLYVSRYFMPAAVLIFILFSGLAITVFKSKLAWIWVLLVYVGMLLLLQSPGYAKGWTLVAEDSSEVVGDKTIVVGDPFSYTSARYYFGENRVRYFNKANPQEDFSGWVVVGNKNRIVDPQELENMRNAVVVDKNCDWTEFGLELEEISKAGELSVCRILE